MSFLDDIDVEAPSRIDRLKVAYALHIARKVMEADKILDLREVELLMVMFPRELLIGCDFLDDEGNLTERWGTVLTEAAALLPIELMPEEKLEILTLLHKVRVADGERHKREGEVVHAAAHHLGVSRGELAAHLKRLDL